jgi:hypothetical protein
MSTRSKKVKPVPTDQVAETKLRAKALSVLGLCFMSINAVTSPYFYEVLGLSNNTRSIAHLLGVSDTTIVAIFTYCGFYNEKKQTFLDTIFVMFIESHNVPIELTRYKWYPPSRTPLLKIGQGDYPKKPGQQKKDNLQPPHHRFRIEERELLDVLVKICGCETTAPVAPPTATTTAPVAPPTTATTTASHPTDLVLSSPPPVAPTMCQKFCVRTPDKATLVMEIVGDMKTPEKAPIMRRLIDGSTVSIESINNKAKKFVHIPLCTNEASASASFRKYKVVEEIVSTLGGGCTSPTGLNLGALWLSQKLANTYRDEYIECAANANITVVNRIMSPEATAAMWHVAKVAKSKQRNIAKHLHSWFGKPITAKETDVDALAGKTYVRRRYGAYSFRSKKGKKESDDDIKKRRMDITIKYWVVDPLQAAEDELITRLHGGKPVTGFKFPLLDTMAIPMCFLADHGNVAWRAGLTVVASEEEGQGEPVFLSHLLGKDSYEVLENTAAPDIRKGLQYLQESMLLIVVFRGERECLLVPRIAFVNANALPFQQIFLEPPVDRGNVNQKLLVDTNLWDAVAQSGTLLYNENDSNEIRGVQWQNSAREDVIKRFRDGASVTFQNQTTTLNCFPLVILGGGDTEWVACALGKENMAGQHCNHCRRSQKDFAEGLGEPWTLETLKVAAAKFRDEILPRSAHLSTQPAGYLGVKHPPLFPIPVHL